MGAARSAQAGRLGAATASGVAGGVAPMSGRKAASRGIGGAVCGRRSRAGGGFLFIF